MTEDRRTNAEVVKSIEDYHGMKCSDVKLLAARLATAERDLAEARAALADALDIWHGSGAAETSDPWGEWEDRVCSIIGRGGQPTCSRKRLSWKTR